MKKILIIILLSILCATPSPAQVPDNQNYDWQNLPREYTLKLTIYRYPNPTIENGDTIWQYLLPEVPVYPPLRFKNKAQMRRYNRLVYNVKKVLPIAQRVNSIIKETYETLEQLPDKKSKDRHIKAVERDLKRQFTPEMKKLTYSQGKLLIKLVDRECNQSSYDIVKAFLGSTRATFYQIFAWTFGASLKKTYDAENDDKMTERVVVQVEKGLL